MLPTPGQSGPGSDSNEGLLHMPQSSSITGASTTLFSVNSGHSLGAGVLLLCREAVGVFYSLSRLGKIYLFASLLNRNLGKIITIYIYIYTQYRTLT